MHGQGIEINRRYQKSLGEYCCVGLNTIYFNLYLKDLDYDNARAYSNIQINSHGPLKKRKWYSALFVEQKEVVHRKKIEVNARKKSIANDAINNKQIAATSARDKDEIVHHEGTTNIEKNNQ